MDETTPENHGRRDAPHVLLLAGDEAVRTACVAALTGAGCRLEIVPEARAAWPVLLNRRFDVAVVGTGAAPGRGEDFQAVARSVWPWMRQLVLDPARTDDACDGAPTAADGAPLVTAVLREARAARRHVEIRGGAAMDRLEDQMAALRRMSEEALTAGTVEDAMRALGRGLNGLVPFEAMGVLHLTGTKHLYHLVTTRPIGEAFLTELEYVMARRFEALTGLARPHETLRLVLTRTADAARPVERVGATFSVPLLRDGRMSGLLTLASTAAELIPPGDLAFLRQAAGALVTTLAAIHRIRDISVRDALTGMLNRSGLEEEYQRAWMLARRYDHPLAVAVLDLDRFKAINDTRGHLVGDAVLMEFATLVREVAGPAAVIARYGGDEMVVVLPEADAAAAIAFSERLLAAARARVFCHPAENIHLSASVGVAAARPHREPELSSAVLLARADTALIRAKGTGRDRVSFYETAPAAGGAPAPRDRATARILIVDDDEMVGSVLQRLLTRRGYEATLENSAETALEILNRSPGVFDVLLTDINMPGIDGLELLERIRSLDESLVRVVITAYANLENAIKSIRRGAYDFLCKPVTADQLFAVMDRAVEYHRLKAENRQYQNHLEDMARAKSAALSDTLAQLERSYEFTLEALVAMVDARETTTGQHSLRVRDLAELLAREMGLPTPEVEEIGRGALLHDIGKIAIPDAILRKPGNLTREERRVMETHPEVGHRILSANRRLEQAARIVLEHQERYDGSGYPRGLKGAGICIGARIFSVVDAYDAMRSDRIYRVGLPIVAALAEIVKGSGTQFDPDVVTAFTRCHDRIEQAGRWDAVNAAARADEAPG